MAGASGALWATSRKMRIFPRSDRKGGEGGAGKLLQALGLPPSPPFSLAPGKLSVQKSRSCGLISIDSGKVWGIHADL